MLAGSTLNGFGLKKSDIDLSLLNGDPNNNEEQPGNYYLEVLKKSVSKYGK